MEPPVILQPRMPAGKENSAAISTTSPSISEGASPMSEVKPLEGKTNIDEKLSFECEMLCYKAISKIAEKVAEEFHTYCKNIQSQNICVIFLDETFKASLQLRQALVFQIEQLAQGFAQLIPVKEEKVPKEVKKAVPGAHLFSLAATAAVAAAKSGFETATTLGHSIIDLLALFRADTSYTGRLVAVKETPFILDLAQKLRTDKEGKPFENFTFIYPKLLLFPIATTHKAREATIDETQEALTDKAQEERNIQTLLAELFEKRECAASQIRKQSAEIAKKENHLADLMAIAAQKHKHYEHDRSLDEKITNQKRVLIPQRLDIESKRSQFEALERRLKELQANLITPDEKTGTVPLHLVQQADEILRRFGETQKHTYFLWADVLTAGGSYRIRRSLLQTFFCKDDGLSYSGGAIVTYAFLDKEANIILSGTHRYREPFTQFPVSKEKEKEGEFV